MHFQLFCSLFQVNMTLNNITIFFFYVTIRHSYFDILESTQISNLSFSSNPSWKTKFGLSVVSSLLQLLYSFKISPLTAWTPRYITSRDKQYALTYLTICIDCELILSFTGCIHCANPQFEVYLVRKQATDNVRLIFVCLYLWDISCPSIKPRGGT